MKNSFRNGTKINLGALCRTSVLNISAHLLHGLGSPSVHTCRHIFCHLKFICKLFKSTNTSIYISENRSFILHSNDTCIKIRRYRARKMPKRVDVPTAEPGNLNSIPRTHVVEERTSSQRLTSDLHTDTVAQALTHTTHKHTK